jgi:serine/threonine protein kinase
VTTDNIHEVGKVLNDRFEVMKVMKGGMGQVFVCKDHSVDTQDLVVLKTFSADSASESYAAYRDRFLKEGEAWFRIGRADEDVNSFYVGLHGTVLINGRPYLKMSYCPGGNLRDRIAHGHLQPKNAISIATQILLGLQIIVDGHGLVHRDIKPENVLFTKYGYAAISDLGIAKFMDACEYTLISVQNTAKLTQYGSFIGTVPYAAPEQLAGLTKIDQGVDIWAFGVLLYEMITGDLPFSGSCMDELANNILHGPVPRLDLVSKCCGKPVAAIVEKCLQKNRSKRYENFQDIIRDWDKVIRFKSSPNVVGLFRKDDRFLLEDGRVEYEFLNFFPGRKSGNLEWSVNQSAMNRCAEAEDLRRIEKPMAALESCRIVLETMVNGRTNLDRLLGQELDAMPHLSEWEEGNRDRVIKWYIIPPKEIAERALYTWMCCYVDMIEAVKEDLSKVREKDCLLAEFLALCSKVKEAKCLSAEVMIMVAEGLLLGGMHDSVLQLLSELQAKNPENDKIANVYWVSAMDYLARESLTDLAVTLLQAHEKRETFLSKMLCARIFGFFKKFARLEEMARSALVFEPTNLYVLHLLAVASLNQSKEEAAWDVFKEMYRLSPGDMLTKKTAAFFGN